MGHWGGCAAERRTGEQGRWMKCDAPYARTFVTSSFSQQHETRYAITPRPLDPLTPRFLDSLTAQPLGPLLRVWESFGMQIIATPRLKSWGTSVRRSSFGVQHSPHYGRMPVDVPKPVKRREPIVHSGIPSGQIESWMLVSSKTSSNSNVMAMYQRGSLRT
jgi:hypothetical protein